MVHLHAPRSVLGALLLALSLVSEVAGGSVSKNPDKKVDKAKLQMLQAYAPARAAIDTAEPSSLSSPDPASGLCTVGDLIGDKCKVHPLIAVYMEEESDSTGEHTGYDIHTAVSLDEGETWKRFNLSKEGQRLKRYKGRKCFTSEGEDDGEGHRRLEDEVQAEFDYEVNAYKPMLVVKGSHALVAWTSTECKGGYEPFVIDDDDKYMVDGSQFCHDYTNEGVGLEEVPFKCVWAARGIMDENGAMTWTQGERLTSGRRDAFQLFGEWTRYFFW